MRRGYDRVKGSIGRSYDEICWDPSWSTLTYTVQRKHPNLPWREPLCSDRRTGGTTANFTFGPQVRADSHRAYLQLVSCLHSTTPSLLILYKQSHYLLYLHIFDDVTQQMTK